MVQAASVNVGLNLESAAFISGAEKARRAMQSSLTGIQADVSKTSTALQGATAAVGGFVKGLALTAGAGLSIAGIVGIATRAAREFSEAEQAQVKFASVLKATGGIAGVTAAEVTKLADALESTGTTTAEAVLGASAALGTFKTVTGETFERAIKLASDLSVVLGGDLQSNAVLLGKALQEPGEALTALTRKGVVFSDAQIDVIKKLQETGQTAAAQTVILDSLAAKVGGATDAQGDTLTGSFNAANAALGNFLEALFAVSGAVETSKGSLQGLIGMLNQGSQALKEGGLPQLLFGDLAKTSPLADQLTTAQKKLAGLEQQLKESTFPGLLKQEAAAAAVEVSRLADAIERTEHSNANALRSAGGGSSTQTVERSLFQPASSAEEERAVNLTKQAFARATEAAKQAAEETTRIASSAATDRIEIAAKTNEDLARFDEERLADFQQSLAAEIEAETKARGVRGQLAQAAVQTQNSLRLQAERESMEALPAFEEEQAANRDRLAQQSADKLADIYAQPFRDLATNISRTLSGGIQDALSGDFDLSTFAEGFGDIFADTLASSITAALVPALTSAAENFGSVLTDAFTSAGGAGGAARGLSIGGAALGGGLFGGIAGGLYGQYAPGMKPGNQAGIGGGLGGAGGAALGAFLMPANPLLGAGIGGVAGGLLGSLTGGLFGGQNNLGNDRSAQAYRSTRGITYGDTSFSPENRNITQGVLDQVSALQKALEEAGGAIANFGLRVEAGNKSGITVNGRKYPDAQAAMAASLEILIGNTSALPVSQQTVLANTKAKDATGIVADLDVAKQFDALTFQGSELTRQLVALDAQMAAFGKKAQALGLDINAVAAAHEKERLVLIEAQAAEQHQIQAAIEGLAPSGDTLSIVLAQLNDQVQELARAAADAGLPLDELAAAHQRAAAQIISANRLMQEGLALQVSALDPASDKLGVALGQLNQQVQGLAAQITASGGSLDALAGAHQRAAADIVNQFHEQQQLQKQQAADEQRRLHEQIKAQQEQARAEAAARQEQIVSFQAQVALLEAGPLEATLIGIRESYRTLIEQGKALGLTAQNEAQIRAAQQRAEQKAWVDDYVARAEATRNFQQQSALLEASPLDAALIQIRERFRELIEQGKAIGLLPANQSQLLAAQARAEAAAHERNRLDQEAFVLQLRGFGAASNDAGLQTAELVLQMKELSLRAAELGVPLNLVSEAGARAAQALKDQQALQKADVQDQIAAAGGGTSSLADQLRVLDVEMRQLERAAAGVGIPLSEVAKAHVKAAQRIRDEWAEMLADMLRQQRDATQGILEAQRGAAGAVDQFLNPFKEALSSRGIGQGVYSGASLTESSLKEFRETLKEARTGDTGALSSLVGIGQGAISQARQTYGSTAAFAEIFREIEAGLREQRDTIESKRDALLSQIGTFTRETVDEIIRLRVQAIGDLRADFVKLSRDLVVAVEGRT